MMRRGWRDSREMGKHVRMRLGGLRLHADKDGCTRIGTPGGDHNAAAGFATLKREGKLSPAPVASRVSTAATHLRAAAPKEKSAPSPR